MAGHYKNWIGSGECSQCPANEYTNETGSVNCTECGEGMTPEAGSTLCGELLPASVLIIAWLLKQKIHIPVNFLFFEPIYFSSNLDDLITCFTIILILW